MNIIFDQFSRKNDIVKNEVDRFLEEVETLEKINNSSVIIYQDGKSESYYLKCSISAKVAVPFLSIDARLNPNSIEKFRANRELLTEHNTYKRMLADAEAGREFNDIIVEYNKDYSPEKPLKIWGGQHRATSIKEALELTGKSRNHGFRVFFNLSIAQRTEIALISNLNIAVSNDLFDRLQEETFVGPKLLDWCVQVGLLKKGENFPDLGSRSERITVKIARTFVTNFYLGREKAEEITNKDLDKNIYEPYLCESGVNLDPKYMNVIEKYGDAVWQDSALLKAGKNFSVLHKAQFDSVKDGKVIKNLKGFRNKALTESVVSSWAFVAGLLQKETTRLSRHFQIPKTTRNVPDPLNSKEMSTFRHDSDDKTYRGLGTRSIIKDRQRMAQLFLAKSTKDNAVIDKNLMISAVSQVVGIKSLQKGYAG